MLYYIRHQGKEHKVRVESRQNQLFVKFDDEPEVPVDLQFFGNDCMFLNDNQVFHANVVGEKTDFTVWRPKGNLQFEVESEYKRIVGFLRGKVLEAENRVVAKMPGKIAKLLVKTGAVVEKGQSLLVMEAMKMENDIRSTIAGEVQTIHVSEGQAVESGALLIELKPSEEG